MPREAWKAWTSSAVATSADLDRWEREGATRVGAELYYVGRQPLAYVQHPTHPTGDRLVG